MDNLRSDITEAILRRAVIEAHEREMAAIPPDEVLKNIYTFSDAHEARMRALFRREARRDFFGKAYFVSKRAAVVVLILATALFGLLMTDSNIQATVRDTILTWYERFTLFRFQGDGYTVGETAWFPDFVPDGFEVTDELEFYIGRIIFFENSYGHSIVFEYSSATDTIVGVDNEYTQLTSITHGGIEYFVSAPLPYSEHRAQVIWNMDGYVFMLLSDLDSGKLLEIALSVARDG